MSNAGDTRQSKAPASLLECGSGGGVLSVGACFLLNMGFGEGG